MKGIALWPEAASTTANQVDWLFWFLFIVCTSVGLLVALLLLGFCVRYRRRDPGALNPEATHQSRALEWFWTLTPLGFFLVMFVWGSWVYFGAYRPPDDAMTIYGVGKQWMWKFQHPEGQREIDMLHVPVGRPVRMLLTSEDVIHSLFIPAFRIHMDLLPERYTSVWFQATRPGNYHLFCSQYCGTGHAGMIGQVVAMSPEDYNQWLTTGAEGSLATQGRQVFLKYRCLSCHSADPEARAPVLEDLYNSRVQLADGSTVRADENYLRESILYPSAKIVAGWQNIMPTFKGQVNEEEIIELIAFLKSLHRGETPPRVEQFPPPVQTPPIDSEEPKP